MLRTKKKKKKKKREWGGGVLFRSGKYVTLSRSTDDGTSFTSDIIKRASIQGTFIHYYTSFV